ncbi:TPA: hypothetical protein NHK58_001418 [Pseudomonas aeruginosa]|nr:hypothetical protein [Pseudomonas aeruginosa]
MKITKLSQIDINDFTIRISKNKNNSKNIFIEFNNDMFWDTLTEKYGDCISCSYNTKSKAYSNLKEGIIDNSILSPEQINNFKQSILQRLKFLLSKRKNPLNNMRQHIKESAVKNATNKKDKDLDVSEFDFSEVENKDFNFDTLLKEDNKEIKIDDFNFEELDEFEEYDTDKEFLEEIKDRENQIKLIDKKIQSELDFFVEVRLDIAKAEKTISDLNELLAERKEVLNQHMEDKVQLRLDIEDFKTCLKYTK